jgi:hypothetical protein
MKKQNGRGKMIDLSKIYNFINDHLGGKNFSQQNKKPQFNYEQISSLLPYQWFDEKSQIFVNQNSIGFILDTNQSAFQTVDKFSLTRSQLIY